MDERQSTGEVARRVPVGRDGVELVFPDGARRRRCWVVEADPDALTVECSGR